MDRGNRARRAIFALVFAVGCVPAPDRPEQAPGPEATAATIATAAWAAAVDADSTRVPPARCELPPDIAQGALVFIQRPDDSSTRIIADYRGPGGRAIESFHALHDTVRLFVRVDEWLGNPDRAVPGTRRVDSLWLAGGSVVRWVDSLGLSRPTDSRSVGARAGNVQGFYNEWLRAVRHCAPGVR